MIIYLFLIDLSTVDSTRNVVCALTITTVDRLLFISFHRRASYIGKYSSWDHDLLLRKLYDLGARLMPSA